MSSREGQWTLETLKEHLTALMDAQDKRNEQRFDAQESAVDRAFQSAKEAVTKAETASEKRFDNTNEWRQAMNDRDLRLVPRTEVDVKLNAITDKLNVVSSRLDTLEGRGSGLNRGWGYLVAAVGLIGTLVTIAILLRH